MAINYNDTVLVTKPIYLAQNKPLDVRGRVAKVSEYKDIRRPYVGMLFYAEQEDTHYEVVSLANGYLRYSDNVILTTPPSGEEGVTYEVIPQMFIDEYKKFRPSTKEDIGLGDVDNTSDINKPISNTTQAALNNKVDKVSGATLLSSADKTKLDGIQSGAQVNPTFKTINGESVTGTGDITMSVEIGEDGTWIINGVDTGVVAEGQDGQAVSSTPLFIESSAPTLPGLYALAEIGEYPNLGGIESQAGFLNIGAFDGTTWSLIQVQINYSPEGKVEEGEVLGVSGDEVYKKTLTQDQFLDRTNLFNKSDTSGNGFYLSQTTGERLVNATSAISPVIPVEADTFYTLSNRGDLDGGSAMVFYNSSGTAMKPLNDSGVEYVSFQTPENGTFKSPAGAVSIQFTTKFVGVGDTSTTILNKGQVALPYVDYYEGVVIKERYIPETPPNPSDYALMVRKDGNNIYVNTKVNNSTDNLQWRMLLRNGITSGSNPSVQLSGEYINNSLWRESSDDICPAYVNGSYIGGNHGWGFATKITKTSHGKTFSDIGSIYSDTSGTEFVIVSITDANNFVILSENLAVDGYSYSYNLNPSGTLSHVSGGEHDDDISSYTYENIANLHTSVTNHTLKMVVDDGEFSTDGDYLTNRFDVNESYDVLDLPSVYSKLVAGAPFSANPTLPSLGADVLFNHTITYRFDENGNNLILHSFRAYKKLNFRFHGFLQQAPLTESGSTIYIPNVSNMTVGAKTWEFTKGTSFDTPSTTIEIKEENWIDDSTPPYRFAQSRGGYRMNAGYILDKGVLTNPNRVEVALMLFTSRKIYPFAKYINASEVMESGDTVSAIAFRSIYKEETVLPHESVVNLKIGQERYFILDYHKNGTSMIKSTPEDYGKNIEVVDGNDKVSLKSEFVEDKIVFSSTATTSDYGFIVIKIK